MICKQLTLIQAERYVMNELYKLERAALEGYKTYNFPRGMSCMRIYRAVLTLHSSYGSFNEFRQYHAFVSIL